MKRSYILIAVSAALLSQTAFAQNFNPKVEVTNTYEGRVMDVHKQDVPMDVPDSLMHFEYKLDYSVFDNPYKGSYEFKPYMIEMRPDVRPSDENTFFLRAGAGYTLHPELDFVFSPAKAKGASLSIYDSFRGYYGPFGQCLEGFDADATPGRFIYGKMDKLSNGYLFDNRLGVSASRNMGRLTLGGDLGYHILASKDTFAKHFYQEGVLKAFLKPVVPSEAGFFRGLELGLNAGSDKLGLDGKDHVMQVDARALATLGKSFSEHSGIFSDVTAQYATTRGYVESSAFLFSITPKFVFDAGRAHLSAGLKISVLDGTSTEYAMYQHNSSIFYPDVHASFFLVPERMKLYADITGGDVINTYASLLERNPYLSTLSAGDVADVLDSSTERVNLKIGFKGSISSHLHYDLGVGYSVYKNGLCDMIDLAGYYFASSNYLYSSPFLYTGGYTYCGYNLFHADVNLVWKSARFDAEGSFRYGQTRFDDKRVWAVAEAPYQAGLSMTYNWNRRVFLGLSASFMSARPCKGAPFGTDYGDDDDAADAGDVGIYTLNVPGYIDLGVHASYRINSAWTAWVKGGNLLNDAVQQYFLHCEKGVSGTIGVIWNF